MITFSLSCSPFLFFHFSIAFLFFLSFFGWHDGSDGISEPFFFFCQAIRNNVAVVQRSGMPLWKSNSKRYGGHWLRNFSCFHAKCKSGPVMYIVAYRIAIWSTCVLGSQLHRHPCPKLNPLLGTQLLAISYQELGARSWEHSSPCPRPSRWVLNVILHFVTSWLI